MTAPKKPSQSPVILDLEETTLPDVPAPGDAPPVGEPDPAAGAHALAIAAASGPGRGRMVLIFLGGILTLAIGLWFDSFLAGLYERHLWLGRLGLGLTIGLASILIAMALREIAALARLTRIEALQRAAADGDVARLLPGLKRLYAGRADLDGASAQVERTRQETPDEATALLVAERAYLAPLDARAERIIAHAARDVAAATALIPMPAIDVIAVLWVNLRMIRRIATVYGGRAGWFGSWRLMRAVASHLVATGAIAATDEMLGPLVGGGVLGKLSRRFGEAAVNAALTARVGVAAIEVCRPMAHSDRPRPRASRIVMDALKGWRAPKE
ncbi:MAG: TIGR01620 family protein [Pseudomonadota bacterium]